MAKRGPLSAAHKAAISAGLKRYYASRSGGRGRTSQNIDTGKQISREDAARIMFGSAAARKKQSSGRKPKRRK